MSGLEAFAGEWSVQGVGIADVLIESTGGEAELCWPIVFHFFGCCGLQLPDVKRSLEAYRIQVLAPVVMFDSETLEDEKDISVSAIPSRKGGIYTALAWSRVKVAAGGLIHSSAKAKIAPLRSVRVCWE